MKTRLPQSGAWAVALTSGGLMGLIACKSAGSGSASRTQFPSDLKSAPRVSSSEVSSYSCGLLSVPISSTVPGDAPAIPNQLAANCFAWWEFISLNWPTEGGGFGQPGDKSPVAWETYASLGEIFLSEGAPPPPFGTQPAPPQSCGSALAKRVGAKSMRVLTDLSPFSASFSNGTDDAQAFPPNAPAWLGAQNGTNVWYEVRVNQDEYDRIVENKWYSATGQASSIAAGVPILLPQGTSQGPTGAIEVKAAWMEVTDPRNAKWQRYKLSEAVIVSTDEPCRDVTVALVGLHIIHKTASQPTWLWATFEHVDNVPDQEQVNAGLVTNADYNFYSPSCQSKQIEVPNAECLTSGVTSPVTVGCTPNTPPPFYLGKGCPDPVPIQITRLLPIDFNAQQANSISQRALDDYASGNVFTNYQLVNVIWSTNPAKDPTSPVFIPAQIRAMNPPTKVANTTLESYAQDKTCTDCHRDATAATVSGQPPSRYSADFSFVLFGAK
jgi:hypothetical protein